MVSSGGGGYHIHQFPITVVACTRPTQDQASGHSSMGRREGSNEIPPLKEQLLAVGSCCREKSNFSLGVTSCSASRGCARLWFGSPQVARWGDASEKAGSDNANCGVRV